MSRPIESVGDIDDTKDLWKIAVRCKHLWSVTSSSNKEHLEMVLLDSKLDMIQVIVPPHLISKFKTELAIGSSYIMQNFKVSHNDFSFKSTTHKFKLVFCGSTSVKKTELPDIPANYFSILDLASSLDGQFQSDVLVDIVGGVTEITQTQVHADNPKNKVVFTITDMSKSLVQCTLWGQLAVQFCDYYKSYTEDGNIIVLLQNARIKTAQESYPLNVSNAWNGIKLFLNDVSIAEISKLKESIQGELPLLSASSIQVESTQTSQFSNFDKFLWKATILILAEIKNLQHETTCVTVAKLVKFEAGQEGWFYNRCGQCTKSVTLMDGKLKCFANHITDEAVPRYKLEVLAVDGNVKAKFVFWDGDCAKLIGKSALQMKMQFIESGDYDPLEFPYELDAILKKELAIRAVFQPKYGRLSVIGFKEDEESRQKVRDNFKTEENTSKLQMHEPSSQDELKSYFEAMSASADYDPAFSNFVLTPSKRTLIDAVEDVESVQMSSTKLAKSIKEEK